MKQSVKATCNSCKGTGLYQGFAEAKGEAVICVNCEGTGGITITYELFEGRKRRNGVRTIRTSLGDFLATGVGGTGATMTYGEFEAQIPDRR